MKARDPRIRSLLRQAKRTAGAGKRAAAQQLYRQITEEAPEAVDGWLGLAATTRDPGRREAAYKQVLALDPDNEIALQAMDGTAPEITAPPARTPTAALETPAEPKAEEEAVQEPAEDPFDQSRAWLEEATQRRRPQREPKQPPAEQPSSETIEPQMEAAEKDPSPAPFSPVEVAVPAAEPVAGTLFCYRHPDRETGLRCYSCDRPICIKCAKRTPVGYRCPQCIREAEGVFYTANALDYLLAGTVSLILGVIAGYIVNFLGFFVIFIGPAAGSLIGRVGFRVARRHHGRWLPHLVATMVAVGGLLPTLLPVVLQLLLGGRFSLAGLGFGLLWPIVYVALATGAAFYQVK